MKAVLYYFSATGNSLVVAKDLATALDNATVVPVGKPQPADRQAGCDTVGIVFPVYLFGPPLIIVKFLEELAVPQDAYVFTVATFGGMPGRPHALAGRLLQKRGITLHAGFSVRMPGNYTPLYEAISREKQKALFTEEKLRVQEIAQMIRERRQEIREEKPAAANFLLHHMVYRVGARMIPRADKDFWVTDACTRCGTCAEVCPVDNIEMRRGLPVWRHHCEQCMACLQWCPAEAIQYKNATPGKKRYRHPEVTLADMRAAEHKGPGADPGERSLE